MIRYVHTNLIARDAGRLIAFYKTVFGCKSIGETRDLRGEWLDALTGIHSSHLVGEHLSLPGYEGQTPTLEIFSYDEVQQSGGGINRAGFAHIAFEVDDVEQTLHDIQMHGGSALGEVVKATYPHNVEATFVYAKDPEGNLLELQSWRDKKEHA